MSFICRLSKFVTCVQFNSVIDKPSLLRFWHSHAVSLLIKNFNWINQVSWQEKDPSLVGFASRELWVFLHDQDYEPVSWIPIGKVSEAVSWISSTNPQPIFPCMSVSHQQCSKLGGATRFTKDYATGLTSCRWAAVNQSKLQIPAKF